MATLYPLLVFLSVSVNIPNSRRQSGGAEQAQTKVTSTKEDEPELSLFSLNVALSG